MATFKVKLEDKAAFLNRMEKAGVELNTNQAVDNKLEGFFSDLVSGATGFLQQFEEITVKKKRFLRSTRTSVETNLRNIDEDKAAGLVAIFADANELMLEIGQKLGMQKDGILDTLSRLKIDTDKFQVTIGCAFGYRVNEAKPKLRQPMNEVVTMVK